MSQVGLKLEIYTLAHACVAADFNSADTWVVRDENSLLEAYTWLTRVVLYGAELMMDVLCAKAWMSDLELSLFNGWYDPVVRASPDLVGGCTRPFSHHAQHILSLDSSLNPKP